MSSGRVEFITRYALDVIQATKGTRLFPSVKMAQMILESADRQGKAGQGVTAVKAKNFFGIKADKNWKGVKMAFSTPKDGKPVNYFRVYSSVYDSIKDHSEFLLKNPRYARGGVFTASTPEGQAWALQKSGYAEGNDGKGGGYADKLIKLIKDYNLKALDNPGKTVAAAGGLGLGALLLTFGLISVLK